MSMTNHLFQLTFPDGWKETTVYTFEGPYDSGIQHNLVLSLLPKFPDNVTLPQYVKSQLEESASALPGFELISEKEIHHSESAGGYETVFRYQPSDDVRYIQKQWYFIFKENVYLFTATFNKKTLKTIGKEIEGVILSLKPELLIPDYNDA
jgi:hypothetical protein